MLEAQDFCKIFVKFGFKNFIYLYIFVIMSIADFTWSKTTMTHFTK